MICLSKEAYAVLRTVYSCVVVADTLMVAAIMFMIHSHPKNPKNNIQQHSMNNIQQHNNFLKGCSNMTFYEQHPTT
jgi:hypothetical protein